MDKPIVRSDGLQLDEHRRFQERFWKIERVAWVAFAVIPIAALSGLTGAGGPLATSTVKAGNATIAYPRIARWETADELVIDLHPTPGAAEHQIRLSPDFAHSFEVEDVQPAASATGIGKDGQLLTFKNGSGDGGQVILHIRAQAVGMRSYSMSIDGEAPLAFTTYVLP